MASMQSVYIFVNRNVTRQYCATTVLQAVAGGAIISCQADSRCYGRR